MEIEICYNLRLLNHRYSYETSRPRIFDGHGYEMSVTDIRDRSLAYFFICHFNLDADPLNLNRIHIKQHKT